MGGVTKEANVRYNRIEWMQSHDALAHILIEAATWLHLICEMSFFIEMRCDILIFVLCTIAIRMNMNESNQISNAMWYEWWNCINVSFEIKNDNSGRNITNT